MRLFNSYIKQYVDCFGMSCSVFQTTSAARLLECIGTVSTPVHTVIYYHTSLNLNLKLMIPCCHTGISTARGTGVVSTVH